ncbi:helix-turn-helix domain-containing protein [Shewanella sp. NIFS-20-20]|uniref:helix-turn-helix domain-containing protein n=1 Tax=Shewanella sp. NIFS-20-20 TaxID=2853806 RepID=UPI001C4719E0|nr:helix-turn-helix domain-containing protein [Shewanella sp. NIFS-20-20]MBV7316487.1 winged helix-turn-helix domain-containing protein [Shewanella sp. NIFS-20-20]
MSKSQLAFNRKLYLAGLIANEPQNLVSLQACTNMPRRTLQDALVACKDIGIEIEFIQQGERHNAGFYRLESWGPINPLWVEAHMTELGRSCCVSDKT